MDVSRSVVGGDGSVCNVAFADCVGGGVRPLCLEVGCGGVPRDTCGSDVVCVLKLVLIIALPPNH